MQPRTTSESCTKCLRLKPIHEGRYWRNIRIFGRNCYLFANTANMNHSTNETLNSWNVVSLDSHTGAAGFRTQLYPEAANWAGPPAREKTLRHICSTDSIHNTALARTTLLHIQLFCSCITHIYSYSGYFQQDITIRSLNAVIFWETKKSTNNLT